MFVKQFFKCAILKCNEKDLIYILRLTDSKTEKILRNKRIDILPSNLVKKVNKESTQVYDIFLKKVMPQECDRLLNKITPILGENHNLIKFFNKLKIENNYKVLEEILLNPEYYLKDINEPKKIAPYVCTFYNNILLSIDVKYLKALAASILDNI